MKKVIFVKIGFFIVLMVSLLKGNVSASAKYCLQLKGSFDSEAEDTQARHLEREGQYLRWDFSRKFPAGDYKVYIRAKGSGSFCLFQLHNELGGINTIQRLKYRINSSEYSDIYLGTIVYDGSYRLTLTDWSSGGLWIDYIYLVPVAENTVLPEFPQKASNVSLLADFEKEEELDTIRIEGLSVALSKKFASSGERSFELSLEMGKHSERELGFLALLSQSITIDNLKIDNWEPYDALAFDAYNPQIFPIRTTLQIQDRDGCSVWPDVILESGWNYIEVPTQRIKNCFITIKEGSPGKIEIDLKRIASVEFAFSQHPEAGERFLKNYEEQKISSVYLDNIRLIPVDIDSMLSQKRNELNRIYEELSLLIRKAEDKNVERKKAEIALSIIERFGNLIPEDYLLEKMFKDYCIKIGKEAMVNLNEAIKKQRKPLPELKSGKLKIKDGNFYIGADPIFLLGPNVWAGNHPYTFWPEKDVSLFSKLGFNYMDVDTYPGAGKEDNHIRLLREEAKKYNIGMNFLLSYHYFPSWAFDKYPEIKRAPGGFMPFYIDHPKSREILETEFYQKVLALIKDEPALFTYGLGNEPGYYDMDNLTDYDLGKFQEWLKMEYKDNINRLNNIWATKYHNFKDIVFPEDAKKSPPKQWMERTWYNQAMWYDWMRFNQGRVTNFFYWLNSTVKKYDPSTPTHIKAGATLYIHYPRYGINFEDMAEITEIVGLDLNIYDQPFREWAFLAGNTTYNIDFWEQAIFQDLYKSLYPGKPIADTEWHFAHMGRWDNEKYIRTAMWHGILHGLRQGSLWVWQWLDGGAGLWDLVRRPYAIKAMAETTVELNRLADYLIKFPPEEGDFAILWSNPSYLQDIFSYRRELWKVYEGLYFLDAPIKFISEGGITSGKLNKYKVLILPKTNFVADETYERIEDFVSSGGSVVLSESLRYDPYGRKREDLFFTNLKRKPVVLATLKDKIEVAEYGKGGIYLVSSMNMEEYRTFFDWLFDEINISRPIRVSNPLVESRAVMLGENTFLTYLINIGLQPVEVNLKTDLGEIINIEDLVRGRRIEEKIELAPQDPTLLKLGVERVEKPVQ